VNRKEATKKWTGLDIQFIFLFPTSANKAFRFWAAVVSTNFGSHSKWNAMHTFGRTASTTVPRLAKHLASGKYFSHYIFLRLRLILFKRKNFRQQG